MKFCGFVATALAGGLVCSISCPGALGNSKQTWVEVRSPHFTVATDAGEKPARKIADQFERFRALFHSAFAQLRVDPGQPIVILAAKNENTMKELLPEEYAAKGHIHHVGLYQGGMEKHYVVLELDVPGDNPYHTLYHEYTHALLHLNFDDLPVWLDEGLAEFYGNSVLGEKETRVGQIDPGHLYILQQSKLLPIDVLLGVDRDSPYYNEKDRASVFYAESWTLVHYLLLDKDARDKQLMSKFLTAFSKSGDQLEAARETFGDLKRFGNELEGYARQSQFLVGVFKIATEANSQGYAARVLSPGEALSLRGDFCTHKNQLDQAEPLLQQAVQLEPQLAIAHENLAAFFYRKDDLNKGDREAKEALRLGATDFLAPYYHGMFLVREGSPSEGGNEEAVQNLDRAVQLNPQFGPGYEALAYAYGHDAANRKKAISAAMKAAQLEPASRTDRLNLADLLINDDQDGQAQKLGEMLLKTAKTPQDEQMARDLLERIEQHKQWLAQTRSSTQGENPEAAVVLKRRPDSPSSATDSGKTGGIPLRIGATTVLALDGAISAADCSRKPEITITFGLRSGPLDFHAADFGKLEVSVADGQKAPSLESCNAWKGRKAKIWFHPIQGKPYGGEITKIQFF